MRECIKATRRRGLQKPCPGPVGFSRRRGGANHSRPWPRAQVHTAARKRGHATHRSMMTQKRETVAAVEERAQPYTTLWHGTSTIGMPNVLCSLHGVYIESMH